MFIIDYLSELNCISETFEIRWCWEAIKNICFAENYKKKIFCENFKVNRTGGPIYAHFLVY